jgi:hypothetical protein
MIGWVGALSQHPPGLDLAVQRYAHLACSQLSLPFVPQRSTRPLPLAAFLPVSDQPVIDLLVTRPPTARRGKHTTHLGPPPVCRSLTCAATCPWSPPRWAREGRGGGRQWRRRPGLTRTCWSRAWRALRQSCAPPARSVAGRALKGNAQIRKGGNVLYWHVAGSTPRGR